MAMTKCKECGNEVSSKATNCPSCGAPTKKPPNTTATCLGCSLIVCLFFGACALWVAKDVADLPPWNEREDSIGAYIMMEKFVKDRLKSPSTAEFPGVFDGQQDHVTTLPDNKYQISSYVDSQNAFGATIRTEFNGVIQQTGELEWHLDWLKLAE